MCIEPWASASFPLGATDHAKFGIATAVSRQSRSMSNEKSAVGDERLHLPGHMIATFLQFDRCLAIETRLPTPLLGNRGKPRVGK